MGFLSTMLSAEAPAHGGVGQEWLARIWGGRKVASGVRVNTTTAFNYSACWSATNLLTSMTSTLPRVMYKQESEKKTHATTHATYRMFRSEPNLRQGGVNFFGQGFNFLINWGNYFAEKEFNLLTGEVVRLWPIHPSRVPAKNIRRNDDGTLTYFVMNDGGRPPTELSQEQMFHVPGILGEDDVYGKGVIQFAAESIGMGIATEQWGAAHFGNGGGPSIVVTHPKTLGEEGQKNIRESWAKRYSDPSKANGLAVFEEDIKVTHLSFPPEANQYLSTRQFNITEIARWYNVPPHLLRELSKSSFNNIESENLHFVLISMMPWLIRWEDECNRQLLQEHEKGLYFFKFLLQGLLRGDMAARAKFYKEMFSMGVYSINDILELEDRNPIGPKGDIRLVPMNMATLDYVYQYGNTSSTKADPAVPQDDSETDDPTKKEDDQETAKLQTLEGLISNLTSLTEAAKSTTVTIPVPESTCDSDAAALKATMATAARSTLQVALQGIISFEGKVAAREAKNIRGFEAWCNEFYSESFKGKYMSVVQPLLTASTVFGVSVTAEQLTEQHCEQSKAQLLSLLSTPNKEFASVVQTTVESWEERAFTDAAMAFDLSKGSA